MDNKLYLYNTLSRRKELFKPVNEGRVGMYVCGPTVYGDAHLGHTRPAITFDVLYRYLMHLGYKVRYVRNITDVGHLEHDADDGEDKVAKKARLEQLEPMEVVQFYLNRYHKAMEALNVLPPSIEPHASGHIIEQIEYIKKILEAGYAYESQGSIYFDVEKYNRDYNYGKLSGRNIEELLNTTRELDGQSEKHNPIDFALWKKAAPEHIMRWPSPWSDGFPGWHLECSTMGEKYLGEVFDIHGGGMDLMFPHHECEIAQSVAHNGHETVHYWMHNNMITINGQKMGKSLGNFITLDEFFTGSHKLLTQAYTPMTIRFFILQAHYRGTVDFSNEALQAAEKAYDRMVDGWRRLQDLKASETSSVDVKEFRPRCYEAMNDDLNTAMVIATLFDACRVINQVNDGKATLTQADIDENQILEAARLINFARRPMALIGQGVILGHAEKELCEFLVKSGMPAAATLLGLSALPSDHPQYVGMLGMHGNYAPNIKNRDCDLLVAIGMRFDDRVTGDPSNFGINAKIIHLEIDPAEINKLVYADVPVLGDVKRTLPMITEKISKCDHSAWIDEFRVCYNIEREEIIEPAIERRGPHLRMGEVVDAVARQFDDAILVTDVGQQQMFASRYFRFKRSRSIITSGGLGTMGFGLPAAIGAKIGAPERDVCLFVGDGGLQMTLQELGTIFQSSVPVKIVLMNNGFLGMVRQWQELFYDRRYSFTELTNPDFELIARGNHIPYRCVESHADLDDAIAEMKECPTAFLLEVRVEREENVFPMVPAGMPVNDIRLE